MELFSVCYAEFLDALNGKNNRFQKHDIESIKGFQLFIEDDIIVAELLEYISAKK